MTKYLRAIIWISLGMLVGALVFAARWPAHALPEYAARTGQACAVCHVNPAGGGPRTVRGLLWVAQGKPDQVPPLPGSATEEPAATTADGKALFDKFGCSGCHGSEGEGGFGPALNREELPANELASIIRSGRGAMMAFGPDVISDVELDALIHYVQALGRGEVQAGPAPEKRPLPPAQLTCGAGSFASPLTTDCGGN
jgi:mono/diheme cytochrome c family protein